jgi:peptide/nickel transport system substrate-binding protein
LDTAKTVAGSKYVYKANPNYWDKANRKYSGLEIFVYENNQTALINALRSGAVQAGNVQNSTAAAILVANAKFQASQSYLDAAGIYFSGRAGKPNSCIKDVKVRQAINTVFDRNGMVQALESGTARATTQFIPSYMPGYDSALNRQYAFNENAAKALMASSGFPQGCSITMPVAVGAFGEALYALIDAQLAKLKIEVKRDAPGSAFIGNIFAGQYDAYYIPLERSADPWTLINFAVSENATFNNDKFSTPAMNKLIEDFRVATEAKRPAIMKSINNILVKDAWFAILYEKQANFVYKGMTVKAPQSGNIIPFLYNIK